MLKRKYITQQSLNQIPPIKRGEGGCKKTCEKRKILHDNAITRHICIHIDRPSFPSFAKRGYEEVKNFFKKKFLPGNTITFFAYLALLLLFTISIVSCGYSSKSLLRSNVRSIYIPVFDNNTFRRGYEFDLTKAVRDQILLRTRLDIVDKDEADSILFGKITSVDENVLIEDTRDNIVESRVSVGIDIRWVDKRTGRTIVERRNIRRPTEFIVRRNETLTSSSNEAFVNVARGIVDAMEEDW